MGNTISLKNENYLAITTIISFGVLSGCEYCSPVLAVLLINPVVKLLIKKIMSKKRPVTNQLTCK